MGGESFDYKFGNKNNWRRWLWNRIRARVNSCADEAIILYLSGEFDLDRPIALSKGFKFNNLLSVERERSVCTEIRKSGVLTICSDVKDVIKSWPVHTPVAAVVLDFCSGIENGVIDLLRDAIFMPPFFEAVWAFNFMRGRDHSTNWLRDELSKNFGEEKHRGILMDDWLTTFLSIAAIKEAHPDWIVSHDSESTKVEFFRFMEYRAELKRHTMPEFNSYKSSSGQVFDSLVWNSPFRTLVPSSTREWATVNYRAECSDKKSKRRISPILAHRTMRMREA